MWTFFRKANYKQLHVNTASKTCELVNNEPSRIGRLKREINRIIAYDRHAFIYLIHVHDFFMSEWVKH